MKKKHLYRKTKRIIVRPFELEDFAAWKEAHESTPKAKNRWDLNPVAAPTKIAFKKMLKHHADSLKADRFYTFALFNEDGKLIGDVLLMDVIRRIAQTCFLGYRIFNPYWGQGYAKEAVRAVLDIGFTDLKIHRIEAGIEPGNIRSIKLAKSLRMRKEGVKKRAVFLRGKWVDLLIYTVTTEDLGYKFTGDGSLRPLRG